MERHPENPPTQASERTALEDSMRLARLRQQNRDRAMIGAWVGATSIALVATLMLLESCGSGGSSRTRATSYSHEAAAKQQQVAVASNGELTSIGGGGGSVQPLATESSVGANAVPPDVVAAVSDTFVTAGQAVEVTVEGTPDITEMALSDGRGDAIPMVRDSAGQLWRVHYRVPLRPQTDRLGLAVTARNESNRWRRVWLFLQVDDGKQSVEPTQPEQGTDEVR